MERVLLAHVQAVFPVDAGDQVKKAVVHPAQNPALDVLIHSRFRLGVIGKAVSKIPIVVAVDAPDNHGRLLKISAQSLRPRMYPMLSLAFIT